MPRISRFLDMASELEQPKPILRKIDELERELDRLEGMIAEFVLANEASAALAPMVVSGAPPRLALSGAPRMDLRAASIGGTVVSPGETGPSVGSRAASVGTSTESAVAPPLSAVRS